jgi:hypothetical protein
MRIILSFIILTFYESICFAEESFKDSILAGYKNRCVQVMSQTENDHTFISKVCNCEAEVIDENFTTFELIIAAGKEKSGLEPMDKEKIKELKVKIKQCKL